MNATSNTLLVKRVIKIYGTRLFLLLLVGRDVPQLIDIVYLAKSQVGMGQTLYGIGYHLQLQASLTVIVVGSYAVLETSVDVLM